jgi:hypothetical protein
MANKKDFTVEELKKMHTDLLKETNTIGEMLKQKEKEEEDKKKAQLALEKEARRKEVDEAFEKFNELQKAYIKDYGSLIITRDIDNDIFPNSFFRGFF